MGASKSLESSGEVRIKHSLIKNEKEFVVKRKKAVLQSLKNLKISCSRDKVPHIALLGSGGGQRAMVGLLGSLVQLDKAGLLDCILYLSGVSGSTWCMASLYQEPDWSTKLETVKNKIIERISGPGVSWGDALTKLKKYYYGKDIFSLTDVWAVLVVTAFVKEIDEHKISEQQDQHNRDPFPIYTMIDKKCKQQRDGDPWFEISPHEAGYSLTGAFVDTSSFGSQFDNGLKKKQQDEIDMLYLQALCGSALADVQEMDCNFLWKRIKDFFTHSILRIETGMFEEIGQDPNSPPVDKCYQVLMELADMNLSVLNDKDPSEIDKSIRTKLKDLAGGKRQLVFPVQKLNLSDKEAAQLYMKQYTMDVCNYLNSWFSFWPFDVCFSICNCMVMWIWGRKYDFLHNMADKAVPDALLASETRDYIDAGLLLNSPYLSVLRKERDTDLIISLDFSEGDPFMTVKEAAEMCNKLKIPFPEVNIPNEDTKKPKDFYVFKGKNAPTVIHIPLFNLGNCGDEIETWWKKYSTFQGAYSPGMIADLMEVAGKNISNNREKLLEQIGAAAGLKKS
ncbi:cytosolic phospholipase A2 gamma [Carassius carassius]|uniref:cytosolic phospholipase A2 gamma n=1 Tax=Carassius carassius TaxID=217509 RepID=UPI0028684E56|nr:cytosolic phospholipase A2 gamma [Carassius carassius]